MELSTSRCRNVSVMCAVKFILSKALAAESYYFGTLTRAKQPTLTFDSS